MRWIPVLMFILAFIGVGHDTNIGYLSGNQ
jgi:hypothetical protein